MATFGAWIRSLHTSKNGNSHATRYSDIGTDAEVYSARLAGSVSIGTHGEFPGKQVLSFDVSPGTQALTNRHPVATIREALEDHAKPELVIYIPNPRDVEQNYSQVTLENYYTSETRILYSDHHGRRKA